MKGHTKKTIYLAAPLAEALRKQPEINFTKICQMALESAAGIGPASAQPSPEMVSNIERIENLVRNSKSALEKIARIAASQAGMVVLTDDEAEIYKSILDIGISQFVYRTKRDAVEAYKAEQEKQRLEKQRVAKQRAQKPRSEKNKAETLNAPPEAPKCVDCGAPSDIPCSGCSAPLCWVCWTGNPDLEGPAKELCQQCVGNSIDSGKTP